MNKIAFIFDGQGNKFNNFGQDFYKNDISFKRFINKYKSSFDIKKEVYEKKDNCINTEVFQPAAFLVEMGIAYLLKKKNIIAKSFAGSSLGEYSAICDAKYLTIEEGILILKKRGHLMNLALSKIDSEMRAIMFLDSKKVKEIAKKYNCEISNENSYDQTVISGLSKDVEKTSNECLKNGARRVIKLDSQGAFHSKYLKKTSKEFGEFLDAFTFKSSIEKNKSNIYYNFTGKKEENTDEFIHKLLVKQFYSKVRFKQIIENMLKDGINTFYEIGAGANLAFHINSIAKAKNKKIKVYKISSYEDYKGII